MWQVISDLLSIILWVVLVLVLIARQRGRTKKAGTADPSRQTNADRIRAMSDDELCVWINAHSACDGCAFCGVCTNPFSAEVCATGVMKWLQQLASPEDANAAALQHKETGGESSQ